MVDQKAAHRIFCDRLLHGSEIEKRQAEKVLLAYGTDPQTFIEKLLIEASAEINQFCSSTLITFIGRVHWPEAGGTPEDRQREARQVALESYECLKSNLFLVKRFMLEDLDLLKIAAGNERREFKRKLAEKVILYWFGDEYPIQKLRKNVKELL